MIQCLSICLLHFALQLQHVVILFLWAQQEGDVDQWQHSGHPTCVAPQSGLLQDVLIQTVGRMLVLFYNRCDFCILVPTWSSRQWRTWCWFRDTTPSRCCWQAEIKGFLLSSLIFLQTTCYWLFFSCKFCLFYVEIYAITCYVDIAYIDVT